MMIPLNQDFPEFKILENLHNNSIYKQNLRNYCLRIGIIIIRTKH